MEKCERKRMNMIFNFYPWTLDVDVEETKELYVQNDFAEDSK